MAEFQVSMTCTEIAVLAEPTWADRMTDRDRRALTPLFWSHVNPYGRFDLDMNARLELAA